MHQHHNTERLSQNSTPRANHLLFVGILFFFSVRCLLPFFALDCCLKKRSFYCFWHLCLLCLLLLFCLFLCLLAFSFFFLHFFSPHSFLLLFFFPFLFLPCSATTTKKHGDQHHYNDSDPDCHCIDFRLFSLCGQRLLTLGPGLFAEREEAPPS